MVITNIIGGLGNQMFQYALGRALALKCNTPLRLDVSSFTSYRLHQWVEFNRVFNCSAEIANVADTRSILGWQSPLRIRQIMSRPDMATFRRKELIVEPYLHYWQEIKNAPCNSYLMGYWQSEEYFAEITEQIREDFTFRQPLKKRNGELMEKMNQQNAVSLHVRRGDYASNPQTTFIHGLCTLDYYRAAIKYIAERVYQPYFYVFSDDIDWVKSNLKIEFSHQYVDHNHGAESYLDMRLMSMCKHHIIANSSFSWWGAWLNRSLDKIVVAPQRWFANQLNARDLLPRSWIIL